MKAQDSLYFHGLSFRGQGEIIGFRKGAKSSTIHILLYYRVKYLHIVPFIRRLQLFVASCRLLGHVLERIGQVLRAEGELADGPDLRVLFVCGVSCAILAVFPVLFCRKRTGFRFFLISVSKVPALRAIIGGAASGSWAMGEPHSEQKMRWTGWPEEPFFA